MQNEERGTVVTVPHLAESLVSATVGKWLKHPGDEVQEYDVLCELMTDKVNVEMPSPIEGTLIRILVQEGESADVGAPICIIREPAQQRAAAMEASDLAKAVGNGEHERSPRYSPAVLHLAEKHRIDLQQLKGTGLDGRITRKDVLAYVKNSGESTVPPAAGQSVSDTQAVPGVQGKSDVPASAAASFAHITKAITFNPAANSRAAVPTANPIPTVSVDSFARQHKEPTVGAENTGDELIPITHLRKVIASRMHQSVSEVPHAWMMMEADVSQLVALRRKLKDGFSSKEGVHLTFAPFVIKAIVHAIKSYPILNSTWASEHIVVKKDIHLSIAVGSEDSVVTPVIRNADRKTIAGLAIELDDLVRRARTGKLTLADMQEGTFTFNNTGSFGSMLSYPIINYPQAAIMTFESIVRKPVVIQDMIAVRSMVNLCLSFDHRILDGMVCGRFIQRVKQCLEQYDQDTSIY